MLFIALDLSTKLHQLEDIASRAFFWSLAHNLHNGASLAILQTRRMTHIEHAAGWIIAFHGLEYYLRSRKRLSGIKGGDDGTLGYLYGPHSCLMDGTVMNQFASCSQDSIAPPRLQVDAGV